MVVVLRAHGLMRLAVAKRSVPGSLPDGGRAGHALFASSIGKGMVTVHFTIYWRGEELFSIGITRDVARPEPVAIGDVSSMHLPVGEDREAGYEEEWEEEAREPAPPRRRIGF